VALPHSSFQSAAFGGGSGRAANTAGGGKWKEIQPPASKKKI